jgi:CDP-diacylglycerol--serine O-phosphatidyltransferase
MTRKSQIPNIVTISNTFLASFSLICAYSGSTELAIRLIFLSLSLDVLDGLLARKLSSMTEEGELLDRVTDRIYQVIVPSLIYVEAMSWSFIAELYAASIITIAFWRLIRKVPAKDRFIGLPLFTHTFVILCGYLSNNIPPVYLMVLMAALSAAPVPYFRRLFKTKPDSTSGTFWQLRTAVPLLLSIVPYNPLQLFFHSLEIGIIFYVLLGWLPFIWQKSQAKTAA